MSVKLTEEKFVATLTTTNSAVTTILAYPVTSSCIFFADVVISARDLVTNDASIFARNYAHRSTAGSSTVFVGAGSFNAPFLAEDDTSWDVSNVNAVNGVNVSVQGDATNPTSWALWLTVYKMEP